MDNANHFGTKTHLDHMVDDFINKAQKYHVDRKIEVNDKAKKAEWDARLGDVKKYLNNQRMQIVAVASVQQELDEYRARARSASDVDLLDEKHHPTDKLERFMRISGKPKPDVKCECHHLVPGVGKTKTKGGVKKHSTNAFDARLKLHQIGIGINDSVNGVWLPANFNCIPHWAMPKALPHRAIHTDNYESWVKGHMDSVNEEEGGRRALIHIAMTLQSGQKRDIVLTDKSQKRYAGRMS